MIEPRKCLYCEKKFKRGRADKLYCSHACRMADCRKRQAREQAEEQAAVELARVQAEAQLRLDAQRQIEEDRARAALLTERAWQEEIVRRPVNGIWDGKTFKPSRAQMQHKFTLCFGPEESDCRVLYPVAEQVGGKYVPKFIRPGLGEPLREFIDESGTMYYMTQKYLQLAENPEFFNQVVRIMIKRAADNRLVEQNAIVNSGFTESQTGHARVTYA